jgi:hypothetical protein
MKDNRLYFAALLIMAIHLPAVAQDCNRNIPTSAPDQRFHNNQDGSITDRRTGLQWSQCSLGQTWNNGSCQDEARALPYAIVELVAEKGWRLPTIGELSSLVELRCSRPAINNTLFPTLADGVYWTDTRFINRDGSYWQVHFLHGEAVPERADSVAFVRWVREN